LNMSDGPAVPANEKLFQDARALLPKPLAQADYIEGSRLVVSHTKVPAGGKGTLAAVIRVKPGQHVQDRNPGVAELIPSRLFIESRPGLSFDAQAQIWPKPQVRAIPGIGSVREHSGEFIIQAPFEIDDKKFEPGPLRLRVLFSYQSCSDAGVCYPPTMAEGFFDFEAVPAGVPAVKNEEFAQLALPTTVEPAGSSSPPQGGPSVAPPAALDQPGLWLIFLGAFIGGAILNITPCVLPVISLKVFGFMRQAGQDRGRVLRMGLVYAAGILASFAVLAVLIMGASFAWGGLMQSPAFLIGLCAFVFAFALSLLGVFEIQLPGAAVSAADAAASQEGYAGAFLNGVFATFLATPCVGPFLGSAVGLLAKTPALVGGAGILIAGLGLAAPYVLLTAFPGWLRWLPRPGAWMVTFKQVLGFILAVVVVWLLSVLIAMVGRGQFLGTLGLLCAVGVGAWLLGKVTLSDSAGRASAKWLTALAAVVAGGCFSFWAFADKPSAIPWQTWEPGLAERLASEGYTVYVDYTASWCLTCQANKRLVLQSDQVAGELKRLGAYPIEADFTSQNREMFKELRQHDRAGVPLNIIVPAGKPGEPIILPEVLTRSIVLEALQRAGPSSKIPEFWTRDP
jgi:thiol:disulfide interchange protein